MLLQLSRCPSGQVSGSSTEHGRVRVSPASGAGSHLRSHADDHRPLAAARALRPATAWPSSCHIARMTVSPAVSRRWRGSGIGSVKGLGRRPSGRRPATSRAPRRAFPHVAHQWAQRRIEITGATRRARAPSLPSATAWHRSRVMAASFYRPISARRPTSQRATDRPWSTPLMSEVRKRTPSQTRALMTSSVIVFQSV